MSLVRALEKPAGSLPYSMILTLSTGAASGFGLATTLRFVAEGAKVIAADMAEEKLNKEYANRKETHIIPIVANVTSQADWKNMVDTAVEKFGGLDILVREPARDTVAVH